MTHLPALVVLLTVLLLFVLAVMVGRARARYGVEAPATTGHPAFERAFRVHMNTLEQAVIFLPTLWLAARYGNPAWAGVLGLIWLLGRVWYAAAYRRDARKRHWGFALGMLAWVLLLLLAVYGVIRIIWLQPG